MWTQMKECCAKRFPSVTAFYQSGGHFFWPCRCLACKVSILPADEGLCGRCWQDLSKAVSGDYCRRCGRDVSPFGIVLGKCGFCQDQQFDYDGLVRVGRYESTLRSMVLSLKFAERTEWASRLSQMLEQSLTSSGMLNDIDFIVPVPLHWRRRLSRGFNQSYMISKGLSKTDIPITTDLVRIRNTQQQWDLTPPQRRRNVKGAFAVRKGHPFSGKNILLVDDISTSGATISECAKTLKQAGARKVIAAVIATAYHD